MTVTTQEIREIQASLSGRAPQWVQQGGAAITSVNGAPSTSTDGVSVLNSVSLSAIFTTVAIIKGASVTDYAGRWWGYNPALGSGEWGLLDNSTRTGLTTNWQQQIASGSITRVYFEMTAITDTGSDGVSAYVGPCDPSA